MRVRDRRARHPRPLRVAQVAGDQPDDRAGVVGRHEPDAVRPEVLIGGIGPLLVGREVDPQLDAVEEAAALQQVLGRHLAVHDAGTGRHPLRGAVGDHAAPAVRIAMTDLAVHHVRHRLEPAMRVVRGALRLARGVLDRTHVVQQQERIGEAQVDAGGRAADLEPLALEELRSVDHAVDRARRPALGRIDARQRRRIRGDQGRHRVLLLTVRRTAGRSWSIPVTSGCPTSRGPCGRRRSARDRSRGRGRSRGRRRR